MKLLPQLILLAVSSLFAVAIGEVMCRLAPQYNDTNPVSLVPHPTLPFTMLPNYSGKTILGHAININGQGFRDTEHSLVKEPGVVRIISLGDSIAFGYGVEGRDSYPEVIERLLNARFPQRRHEVFNYGISGFNLADYYNLFEETGLQYQPDLIVVGLSSSDYTHVQYREVIRDGVGMRPGSFWTTYNVPAFVLRLLRHSALYLTVGNALKRLSAARNAPAVARVDPQEVIKTKALVSEYLSKFNALARRRNIPIVYAFFPKQTEVLDGAAEYPEFISLIASTASKSGSVRFANLMDDLKAFKETPQEVFIKQDWVHPTPRGHALYAERIAAEIATLDLRRTAGRN